MRKRKIHVILIVIVVAIAVIQSYPLFYGKYTWNTGSIESAYIVQSRILFENLPLPGWSPLWYGGHPFKLSYSPGFLYVVGLASLLLRVDIIEAYRRITALTLLSLPLAIYFFTYSLSRSTHVGFLSSILYLSFPSLHRSIYSNLSAPPFPDQVTLVGLYGETPHLLGLVLALTSATLFYQYIVFRRRLLLVAATFTIALVNLVNLIAAVSLLIILLVIVVLSDWSIFKKFIASYLLGLGLCLFVYDYEYIHALVKYAQSTAIGQNITVPHIFPIIFILSSTYALAKVMETKTRTKSLPITLLLTTTFLLVVIFNKFMSIQLLPQAVRYNPEFDISLYSFSATLLVTIFNKLRRSRYIAIMLVLIIAMYFYVQGLPHAWDMLRIGDQRIMSSLEKKVADEVSSLPGDLFGPRIYCTGSIAFWLNVFTDKPQVRGGYDVAGSINPMWAHIAYFINTSPNSTLSIKWLKAFNVRYVVVDLPSAHLPYKDYKHPYKFEDKLDIVKEVDGVKIYEVPLSDPRPIQLIKKVDNPPLIKDIHNLKELQTYLDLVENSSCSSKLDYRIISTNSIEAHIGELKDDCYLLFKVNYDDRWKAYLNASELRPNPIGPGFMFYDLSGIRGAVKIDITYSGENIVDWIFNTLSVASLVTIIVYCFKIDRTIYGKF
ncbi:MAG: hypothetical protein QXU34_05925 [Ignisphaera sp.]